MLEGLRTVVYGVSDLQKAKEWYIKVTGVKPYFDEPFYVGFNIGGYELGLDPNLKPAISRHPGVVAYWGVNNIEKELKRLKSLGVTIHDDIQNVGGELKVASVLDPFGNVFGLIYNPDFSLQ